MQIEVPQGKSVINLPNGTKIQVPQGKSKVNVPDDMFGDKTISNQITNPNSANSYISGATPAPKAPQTNNRVEKKSSWMDYIPFIKEPIALAKDIAPDIKRGADQINNVMGLQPIVNTTKEAIDYSQKKSDFENIEFRYRDLLDFATKEGRDKLKLKQEQIDKDFAQTMIDKFGADDVVMNSKGQMAVVKDGKRHEINDGLWDAIKSGTWSSRSEIGADITGGAVGGIIGNLINKDPKKKAISSILGGLAGSATSSMFGRYVDAMRNAYNTRQQLNTDQKVDIMADAGGGNAVLGVGATAGISAIAKPTMAVIRRAKSFIADGNLEAGIKHIEEAGYTREEAENILKEQDKFSEREMPFLNTSKAKDQDMLQAVANKDSQLASDVNKELKTNMSGASGVIENVDGRAKYIIEQIQKNSSTPKEIQEKITSYIDGVKKRYKDTKESLLKIMPEKVFDITQTSIPEQIAKFETYIGTVDGKEEIKALLARIKDKGKLTIAEMIDVRGEINSILSKQKKYIGKEAIADIKASLDQHIDGLIEQMPENELADQAWKEAVDDYHIMKDMEGDVAYADIFNKKATPESIDKALQVHSSTINKTLEKITQNLHPQEQARIEGRIIESIVEKMTSGKSHNAQAIDFPAVAEKLKELNIKTPEAQEMVELITKMADMFQNDVKFLKTAEKRTSPKMNQGLSYNFFVRARTMLANQFMGIVSKFMTGEAGRSASFRHHVMQSLRRERTPIGFVTKLAEHPETPAKAIEQLKIIAKQIDEQNQELKAEKLKQEKLDKLEQEAKNAELIKQRDLKLQQELEAKNEPIGNKYNSQTTKVNEAKTPEVGGSEDKAKDKVKELFKKNDDKPTHLTKEDEAELERQMIEDEANQVFANGSGHLGVGAFTGTANATDDYENKTPEQIAMDFIKGFGAGAIGSKVGAKALKGTKAMDFIKDIAKTEKGGVKAGMFVGTEPQGTIYTKQLKEKFKPKIQEINRLIKIYANEKPSQPAKVFRGVSKDGELINNNSGMASEGYGLYTTTNKKLAKDYGDVIELDGTHLPKTPLAFADYNQYEIFMQQLMYKIAGYKRASEFSNISPNETIHAINPLIDGIQIGKGSKRFWVKFPDINEVADKQNLVPYYDKGAFSDIATKQLMKEIDDSKAIINENAIKNITDNKHNIGKNRVKSMIYKPLDGGKIEVSFQKSGAKSTKDFIDMTLDDKQLKEMLSEDSYKKVINKEGEDWSELYDTQAFNIKLADETIDVNQGGKLSDYLKHDELFKQYPELKDIDTAFMDGVDGAYLGKAKDELGNINPIIVIGNVKKKTKSALLHEIQHAIQNKEGWARGGNPEMFEKTPIEIKQGEWASIILSDSKDEKSIKETLRYFADDIMNNDYDAKDVEVINKLIHDKNPLKTLEEWKNKSQIPNNSFDKYQRLHGEQMSRATQARMDMTPAQREKESWTDTLKRVEGEYKEPIIKYDSGVAMSKGKPLHVNTKEDKKPKKTGNPILDKILK